MKVCLSTRQIAQKKLLNEGAEMKHLRRRYNIYNFRQQKAVFKNPIYTPVKANILTDFLTLVGVLPILRP